MFLFVLFVGNQYECPMTTAALGYLGSIAMNEAIEHEEENALDAPISTNEFYSATELASKKGSTTLQKLEWYFWG